MALQIISVVLFTVFFSEALTLMCFNCTDTNITAETCNQTANCSSSSQCSSMTTSMPTYNVEQSCAAASCVTWSKNNGWVRKSSKCCSSDFCNNATDSVNQLSCYTCTGTNCKNTLKCKGVEDRCFTAVESSGTFKGCASQNLCDNSTLLNSTLLNSTLLNSTLLNSTLSQLLLKSSSCCEANLCNNAQKMTQGPVLLLVPILSLLFHILDLF